MINEIINNNVSHVYVYFRLEWVVNLPGHWFKRSIHNANCSALRWHSSPGRVAQSVTCLATDACLTADPGVASSIPVRSHTFVKIDHEIISTVILLPSADLFKKGCCQLQAKVCARITDHYSLTASSSLPRKGVVRWTDRPAMTIAVDLGRKATKQTNLLSINIVTNDSSTCKV